MIYRAKVRDLKAPRTKKQALEMIKAKGLEYSDELIATFNNGKLQDVNINFSPF